MRKRLAALRAVLPLGLLLGLGACAVAPPTGPTVTVLPGKDVTFAAFQQDDTVCRSYAANRIGGASPAAAGAASGVGTAALATGLGAAAGAAIGSVGGAMGAGAAIGGASGLLLGAMLGTQASAASAAGMQGQYNVAYAQCMTAKGNTLAPGSSLASGGYGYGAPPAYPSYPYYGYPSYGYSPYYYGYGPYIGFGWGG